MLQAAFFCSFIPGGEVRGHSGPIPIFHELSSQALLSSDALRVGPFVAHSESLAAISEVEQLEIRCRRVFEHEVLIDFHGAPPSAMNGVPHAEAHHKKNASRHGARESFRLKFRCDDCKRKIPEHICDQSDDG